jgi:hypothetical protein
MDDSEPMIVALRVLCTIREGVPPEPEDLEHLRRVAPPMNDATADELACHVVQQALRYRSGVQ